MIHLYYTEGYRAYNFGPDHPLRPDRVEMAYRLMDEAGCLDYGDVKRVDPVMASEAEILRVHTEDYIEAVIAGRPDLHFGLGDMDTPVFPGMYDAARLVAGGSIQAAEAMIEEDISAFNIGGGLHHAFPSRAAGFCIFNDPALAIDVLKRKFQRVLYIDIDAHHGDGVQKVFYEDPRVLTVSLHESGRYLFPGTGFIEEIGHGPGQGYSVNIPMPMYSGDDAYARAFEEIVPALFDWFRPDAVVSQIGIDTHYSDPLTSLLLSLEGYGFMVKRIKELADKYAGGRMLAFGGGGYSPGIAPVAWTRALQIMRGQDLSSIPPRWAELLQNEVGMDPIDLPDKAPPPRPGKEEAIRQELEETLSGLKVILSAVDGIF